MAPGEGAVHHWSVHDGLYPLITSDNLVEDLKQRFSLRPSDAVPPSPPPRQNVRISFASVHCAAGSNVEIERALAEGTVAPKLKRPRWSFRFPFVDDANPSAAETALNHVYAGTMARTLSQVSNPRQSCLLLL
jgi:hypothetical protein